MESQNSEDSDTPMADVLSISALSLPHRTSPSIHGPLPDSKSQSVPSRMFLPWPLFDLNLRIEVRDGRTQGLSDHPNTTLDICLQMLLHARFKEIDLSNGRSHHLSFESFKRILSTSYLSIDLDLNNNELGWAYQSQLPDRTPQYLPILDESTFQNAIGVMRNQTSMQNPATTSVLTLHIFARRHKEGFFRRGQRAPQSSLHPNLGHTKSTPGSAADVTENLGEDEPEPDLYGSSPKMPLRIRGPGDWSIRSHSL